LLQLFLLASIFSPALERFTQYICPLEILELLLFGLKCFNHLEFQFPYGEYLESSNIFPVSNILITNNGLALIPLEPLAKTMLDKPILPILLDFMDNGFLKLNLIVLNQHLIQIMFYHFPIPYSCYGILFQFHSLFLFDEAL